MIIKWCAAINFFVGAIGGFLLNMKDRHMDAICLMMMATMFACSCLVLVKKEDR